MAPVTNDPVQHLLHSPIFAAIKQSFNSTIQSNQSFSFVYVLFSKEGKTFTYYSKMFNHPWPVQLPAHEVAVDCIVLLQRFLSLCGFFQK